MASLISQDLDILLPPGGALGGRLFSRLVGETHDDPPLEPGTRIGDWRIDTLLGRGGSSMVYLADRADGHFEQQVALKIVRSNRRFAGQFRRERQILAELRHPGIARLIDGGDIDDGRLWFAMEPVFGERIDHYVRNRRVPLTDRLVLFEEVCQAVAYAHRRLLIHRDIKPGNLLVDETGWPRLLDFGIATSHGADEADDRAMTPTYASPEQHAGGAVTTASDIYQLGALLRTLVMPDGEPCGTLPQRPRKVVLAELSAIIARATAYDPAHRYAAVAGLRADSAAVRQRRRVSVIAGIRHPVGRFFERHAVSSMIACIASMALIATGWVAARRIGIERDQAREAADRARATRDFLVDLYLVPDPREGRGETLTADELLSHGAARLQEASKKDPAQAATVMLEIGRIYMEMGEFTRARDALASEIARMEQGRLAHSPEQTGLLMLRGRALLHMGDYKAADADFARVRDDIGRINDSAQRRIAQRSLATSMAELSRRSENATTR